jgi:hypothetical protein
MIFTKLKLGFSAILCAGLVVAALGGTLSWAGVGQETMSPPPEGSSRDTEQSQVNAGHLRGPASGAVANVADPLAVAPAKECPAKTDAREGKNDSKRRERLNKDRPTTPPGQLPTVQYVNKRQVKLGFNVTRIGPSGLGGVDVYITTDEGATWEKSTPDSKVSLPVSPGTRGTVTVPMAKEGVIYGFYLVIKSKAGRGKSPPRPGDIPQVRVEMDLTTPVATLRAPQPAPGRHDSLILIWEATDRNLAQNPISLEWSKTANGPWVHIGHAQLPNTGKYTWVMHDGVPPMVYLRLTVRDMAGNVAVAQTSEPLLIDLVEPDLEGVGVVHH